MSQKPQYFSLSENNSLRGIGWQCTHGGRSAARVGSRARSWRASRVRDCRRSTAAGPRPPWTRAPRRPNRASRATGRTARAACRCWSATGARRPPPARSAPTCADLRAAPAAASVRPLPPAPAEEKRRKTLTHTISRFLCELYRCSPRSPTSGLVSSECKLRAAPSCLWESKGKLRSAWETRFSSTVHKHKG